MERSKHILEGLGSQYYRATLKSMGFTTDDLKRPVIGIANTWSECVPGHFNLRQVAQRVKDGIYRAGGTPIEFGTIGGCDGMGQGHDGMHYILPSQELIANSIESMAQINLFDGLVLLGSCDKIVPGMLMAAARLDIPCIFLPGGGLAPAASAVRLMKGEETDVMTVTAHTLAENIASHRYLYPATSLVNHTLDNPFGFSGGVAVLRGSLAPDTGITKPGAFDKSLHHFEGEAICFDSEEEAEEAILAGKVHDGHVVVIRYEGPKGGPGMREMYKAMKYLYGRGLSKTTALITDGRFSGTNNGCFVGHMSPEAAEGGPIAIVHDGDRIVIDIEKRQLDLMVPQEEIDERLKNWKRPEPKFKKGWLGLYCKIAASGSEGAILKFDNL